jgi:hypothetical protein
MRYFMFQCKRRPVTLMLAINFSLSSSVNNSVKCIVCSAAKLPSVKGDTLLKYR